MLGPVSGTGRAMMASLQQAMSNGMPPDQAIQYVKSMATQGVAPMADLYAMMNQFQRLKQQPVQAPQTPPTIRDQLNMAEQQQMAMQQGLGGLPAPSMEQAQFAGGGIVAFDEGGPVGDVESEITRLEEALRTDDYIKQGSGGSLGRVMTTRTMPMGYAQRLEAERKLERLKSTPRPKVKAEPDFLPSGPPVKSEFKLPSDYGSPQQPTEQGAAPDIFVAPSGTRGPVTRREAPPAPRTDTTSRGGIDSRVPAAPRVAAEAPAEKKMTIEDYLAPLREAGKPLREATDAYRQFLDKDEASAKEQSSRDRMLALAQAGFGMAEAASKPGATFLGSAAAAGGGYAKNMMQLNREADAAKRGIVKERLALAQAEAAGNKADYVAAYQNLNEYEKRLTQADQFKQEIDLKRAGLAIERSLGFARVNAELVNSGMMAGLRKDEAAARAQNELRDLQAKIVTLADSRIGRLMMNETYRKATAEERAAMEQTEYETAAKLLGGNLLSGGASGSAGQWGQVTVKP
jgi:hypothetical protein